MVLVEVIKLALSILSLASAFIEKEHITLSYTNIVPLEGKH